MSMLDIHTLVVDTKRVLSFDHCRPMHFQSCHSSRIILQQAVQGGPKNWRHFLIARMCKAGFNFCFDHVFFSCKPPRYRCLCINFSSIFYATGILSSALVDYAVGTCWALVYLSKRELTRRRSEKCTCNRCCLPYYTWLLQLSAALLLVNRRILSKKLRWPLGCSGFFTFSLLTGWLTMFPFIPHPLSFTL